MTTTPDFKTMERLDTLGRSSMCNLDHSIRDGLEDQLRANPNGCWASHTAWNFFGKVWFDGEQFCEQVMVHGRNVEVIRAPTLKELMDAVNTKYGSE